MTQVATEFVPSFDGERLAVHRLGAGKPMLLLHGLFSDADTNWIKFGHARRLVLAGYEVVMPDLRAHGDSAAPHSASAYPQDVLVKDAAALVEYFGWSGYILGGFSLGARTVLHAVASGVMAPEKLIVAGMGLQGLTGWEKRAEFFRGVIDNFDTIRPGEPAYFARQFLKTQGVDRVAARHLLGTLSDLVPGALENVTVPTLVVCGDEDQDNGSAHELAEALPNARYVSVPGTHMSSVTKPQLSEAMVQWLEKE